MKKFFLLLMMSVLSLGVGWAATIWQETPASGLATGDIVVIVDKTSEMAMSNDKGTSSAPVATEVSFATNKTLLVAPSDNLKWEVTVSNGSYQFNVPETTNYLYCTAANNGVRVGGNANNAFTIHDNDGVPFLLNTATNRYLGVYNKADWRCYTSINNNIKDNVLAFYKKIESGEDEPDPVSPTATVNFNPGSGELDYGATVTLSLNGEASGIKYTLDGSDPTSASSTYAAPIAIKSDVTIKAAAYNFSNAKYALGTVASATYTVKALEGKEYTRVTSISSADLGRKFILVYEGGSVAMGAVDSYGASVALNNLSNDGKATITHEQVVPVTLGGEADAWTFDTGSGLLAWSSSNSLNANETGSTWKVTFDGNNAEIRPTNDNNRVIQYNTGSPRFACYTGSQKAIQLYREVVADELAAPEISGNANFVGSTEVTITAAEGASIYYTTDGTEPTTASTPYSAAFTINATTTVKAIAVLDGKTSGVASKTFTAIASVASIAEFNELDDNEVRAFSTSLVAVGQSGSYLYAQDNEKGILIYGNTGQTYAKGAVIPAGFSGKKTTFKDLPELTEPSGFEASSETVEVTPIEITPAQVNADNFARYAVIRGATVSESTITVDDEQIALYSGRFNVALPEDLSKTYDVYGICGKYNDFQFMPLEFVEVQAEAVPDYYLVGSFNMEGDNWITDDENYKFTKQAAGGYKLADVTLPDNVEFKIVKKEDGNITAWLGGASNEATYGIHGGWHADMPLNGENTAKNFSMAAGGVCTLTISDDMKLTVDKQPSMAISASFNNWGKTAMTASDEGWTAEIELTEAGEFGFKDEWNNWKGGNGTAITDDNLGTELTLANNGNFNIPAGKWTLNVNAERTTLVVDRVYAEHAITIASDIVNGTVATDVTAAKKGTVVTITATPAQGYTLEAITVTGEDNTAIEVTEGKFTMPDQPVTVSATFKTFEYAQQFKKVTRLDQLVAGKQVLIVGTANDAVYVMGAQTSNNRTGVAIENATTLPATIQYNSSYAPMVLGKSGENYTFFDPIEAGYLYAASSSKNHLRTEASLDDNGKAALEMSEEDKSFTVTFQGENTRNIMRFNANNGSPIFSCYASGQQPVYFYVESDGTATYALEGVRFTQDNKYATWFGDKDLALPEGVSAYVVSGVSGEEATISAIEYIPANVGVILECATPNESDLTTAEYDGTPIDIASLLQGSLESTEIENGYVLYNDEFVLTSAGTLAAHRCYLPKQNAAGAPERLRIGASGVVTAIDDVNAARVAAVKYVSVTGQVSDRPFNGVNIVVTRNTDGTITTTKVVR